MKNLRIKEALANHLANTGVNIEPILAAKIWPHSKPDTRGVNMRNLKAGRTFPKNLEVILIICETTGVDPNFLCGVDPKN